MAETQEFNIAEESEQKYLGTVYAKALLGATEKSGTTQQALNELSSLINDVLAKLPKLQSALDSPRVKMEEKEALIDKAIGKTASKEFVNFIKVVCSHGRFNILRMIYKVARQMNNASQGRVEATLITAETADAATQSKVIAQLKTTLGREIDLQVRVDPNIIGGMMVRVGDTVYDSSVSNQLEQLRTTAMQSAMTEIRTSLDRFLVDA